MRRSSDLTKSIIGRLTAMISRGVLKPGVRLPSERELAASFGVNRGSLREALKTLVGMGMLVQRVGDGTYLSPDAYVRRVPRTPLASMMEGLSFAELFETRRIVEPELAARAAMRRSNSDLAELDSASLVMTRGISSRRLSTAVSGERRFHRCLWQAAGDRVICRMLEPVHTIIGESIQRSWTVTDYARAVKQHENIMNAVQSGDPEAAGRAMNLHLDVTASILSRVFRVNIP